jgi:predicted Rossmann fold nucleotide-binding protein DprA/Smf involved in DNA uptake
MAHLCTSAEDILDKMNWRKTEKKLSLEPLQINTISSNPNQNLFNEQQREILRLIDAGNSRVQDLTAALPFWTIAEILAITSHLQIQGMLVRENNQEFRILRHSH